MESDDLLRAGPVEVSADVACAAWLDGCRLDLGIRQVRVLATLVRARGRLVPRHELFEAATGRPLPLRSRAIDMDVWRLRQALGPLGEYIRSVRKVGYAIDVDALDRLAKTRDHFETSIFHG